MYISLSQSSITILLFLDTQVTRRLRGNISGGMANKAPDGTSNANNDDAIQRKHISTINIDYLDPFSPELMMLTRYIEPHTDTGQTDRQPGLALRLCVFSTVYPRFCRPPQL